MELAVVVGTYNLQPTTKKMALMSHDVTLSFFVRFLNSKFNIKFIKLKKLKLI